MTESTLLTDEQQAEFLRDSAAGLYLSASVGPCLGNQITPTGFKQYLADLRQSAGASSNPLVQLLWEQFSLAHHNLGRLYSQASQSKTIDEMQAYSMVIIKLHAELRLLGETLNRLQKPGEAHAADDHDRRKSAARRGNSESRDIKLGSNESGDADDRTVIPFTEPTPRRRRPTKSTASAGAFG